MANTFNLGNGNWAQKTEKLLAYNAENDNYKPLPFDFDRASTATRVNKQGLIETVGTDEPRIDFLNNTKGHLLLEPSRTNLVTYSEDFSNSYWQHNADITVTSSSELAPNGKLNANLIEFDGSGYSFIRTSEGIPSTAATISVFAKKGNWRYLGLRNFQANGNDHTVFDFDTQTFSNTASGQAASFEIFPNGWYKIKVTQPSPEANPFLGFTISNSTGSEANTTGGQVANVHLFGVQVEQGSYATSYIPTSGSAVTRSAETCNSAGNSTVFNDSEGVLYAEIAKDTTSVDGGIAISDSSYTNRVLFYFDTSGNIRAYVYSSGEQANIITSGLDYTDNNKLALKYSATSTKLFVNGFQVGSTDTSSTMPVGLSELAFDDGGGGSDFYGKTKEIRVYNTALTDAELIALTS